MKSEIIYLSNIVCDSATVVCFMLCLVLLKCLKYRTALDEGKRRKQRSCFMATHTGNLQCLVIYSSEYCLILKY